MELSIDTSTRTAGVALSNKGESIGEMVWEAEYNHTTQLMPAVEYLMGQAGAKPKDLTAIIVAVGPGSYSGLRVGISAAKGLATALNIPMAGVNTLLLEAYPFLVMGLPVQSLLDAGRGEVSTGRFRKIAATTGLETMEPAILTIELLCDLIKEPTLFCGEHLPAVREVIVGRLGTLSVCPPNSALLRRPSCLAELGWQRLKRSEGEDPASIQPVYLRPPSITLPGKTRSISAAS